MNSPTGLLFACAFAMLQMHMQEEAPSPKPEQVAPPTLDSFLDEQSQGREKMIQYHQEKIEKARNGQFVKTDKSGLILEANPGDLWDNRPPAVIEAEQNKFISQLEKEIEQHQKAKQALLEGYDEPARHLVADEIDSLNYAANFNMKNGGAEGIALGRKYVEEINRLRVLLKPKFPNNS